MRGKALRVLAGRWVLNCLLSAVCLLVHGESFGSLYSYIVDILQAILLPSVVLRQRLLPDIFLVLRDVLQ